MNKTPILPPFKRFCVTIGNLPSSYVDSMSYYECLMWLCKFLQEQVIPTVNENAEAVNELINWFNNLDVQDEIDNKLDEMVEDGTLAEIINQEIFSELNTQVQTNTEDLTTIKPIVQSNTNSINLINSNYTIMIGDSYALESAGYIGWQDPLQTLLELTDSEVVKIADNGGGFVKTGDLGTFKNALTNTPVTNANLVKNIIVCGGINDREQSVLAIETAISEFVTYCKTRFPNAQVYVGHISGNKAITSDGQFQRFRMFGRSLPSYKNCSKYGAIYLNGVEFIMKNYDNYINDSHPNDTGCMNIAKGIYQAFKTGYCSIDYDRQGNIQIMNQDSQINYYFSNNKFGIDGLFRYEQAINLAEATNIDGMFDLGAVDFKYYRNVFPWFPTIPVMGIIHGSSNISFNGELIINDGHLYLRFIGNGSESATAVTSIGFRAFNKEIDGTFC